MKRYTIDSATRLITPVDSKEALGVLYDNLLDGAVFELSGYAARMYDHNHPNLSIHHKLGDDETIYVSDIPSERIDESEDKLVFTWILDRSATRFAGDIKFSICMILPEGKEWNTTFFKDKILDAIEDENMSDDSEAAFKTLYDQMIENFRQYAASQITSDLVAQYIREHPEALSGGYKVPEGGIPKTDLSAAVQISLGKADSAVQATALTNYYTKSQIDELASNIPTGGTTTTIISSGSDGSCVIIEDFGGGPNKSASENDKAFKDALTYSLTKGMPLKFGSSHETYNFSENIIDLGSEGRRTEIDFNYNKIKNLCFRWNMKANGVDPVVTSGIESCYFTMRNVDFRGNSQRPVIITAAPIQLFDFTCSGMIAVVGYTNRYVDYFLAERGACWNVANFLVTVDYNGNIIEDGGTYGDWFKFRSITFSQNLEGTVPTVVFKPSTTLLHKSTVYVTDCLHGIYPVVNAQKVKNKFIFDKSHMEQASFVQNLNPEHCVHGFIKFNDGFCYASVLPDDMRGVKLNGLEISYGLAAHSKTLDLYSGKFTKYFNDYTITFDESDFYNGERSAEPILRKNDYSTSVGVVMESASYRGFSQAKSVRYLVTSSLEKDRLYFGKTAPQMSVWSGRVTTQVGRAVSIVCGGATGKTDRVFIWVFREIDGAIEYAVIPVTQYVIMNPQYTVGTTLQLIDEGSDIAGYSWKPYTGSIAFTT